MEELEIYDFPSKWKGPWCFVTLYRNGEEKSWQVAYEDEELYTTDDDIIETKNNKDAFKKATKLYIDKINEGYLPGGCVQLPLMKAMKANSFRDGEEYLVKKIKNWPVAMEPKLGGIRFFVIKEFTEVKGYGANHNTINHLSHIIDDITHLMDYLPPFMRLDGELYIHGADINVIRSMVKSDKNLHPQLPHLQYHIYDIAIENVPYEDRKDILVCAYERLVDSGYKPKYFGIVPSYLAYDIDDILDIHESFVAMGIEGSMIKKMANDNEKFKEQSYYKFNSRCDNILKLKDIDDGEFEIIDVTASGTNNIIFTLKTEKGINFNASYLNSGNNDEDNELRREYLDNRRQLKGKMATVIYKKLSEKGVPLFGKVKCVRDYE